MAQYRISMTVTTETKEPRRGERERLRYLLLRLLSQDEGGISPLDHPDVSQRTRRSLRVKRVV